MNKSKIRDPRMWERWRASGAVGTMDLAEFHAKYAAAPLGDDRCLICCKFVENVKIGDWLYVCKDCSNLEEKW